MNKSFTMTKEQIALEIAEASLSAHNASITADNADNAYEEYINHTEEEKVKQVEKVNLAIRECSNAYEKLNDLVESYRASIECDHKTLKFCSESA
jgi:phosphopantothenate synthetase